MGNTAKRFIAFLILLIITVQGALLCCSFAVSAGERSVLFLHPEKGRLDMDAVRPAVLAMPADAIKAAFDSPDAAFDDAVTAVYAQWLQENVSTGIYTREEWLRELMNVTGIGEQNNGSYAFSDQYLYACCDLFVAAYEHNMVYSQIHMDPYAPVTRSYLAKSVCGALGYTAQSISCADLSSVETDMMTLVYYGYYTPDDTDCVYPDRAVSRKEAQEILSLVKQNVALRGKHILSFGDSIMHGMGNRAHGIADMAGERFSMSVTDYSVNGASYEKLADHDTIIDQITAAIKKGETADIILINGMTNDLSKGTLGTPLRDRNYKAANRKTFAGAFEYAIGTLKAAYPHTPIVYVRPHNMVTTSETTEKEFGETAIAIAHKWGVATVDVYNDTDLNTEIEAMREKYTLYRSDKGDYDSVHPNGACYARYYLPLVADEMIDLLI